MPYKDAATRRERRRDYMREFMRRTRSAAKDGRSPRNVSPPPVSAHQDVSSPTSTAQHVGARVNYPAKTRFVPYKPPPTGLTPLLKIRAKKVWGLTTTPREPQASKDMARRNFAEMAERAGVTPGDLLIAIGVAP